MKRTLLAIVATLMMATAVNAQRLTDVTAEARYTTDKMTVELGLTSFQRNNILNINIAYLDGINSYRDLDTRGWSCRNEQIRAMLTPAQWKKFKDCYYFYRPIDWRNNAYVHNIYNKYPRTDRRMPAVNLDKRMDKGSSPCRDMAKLVQRGQKDASFKDCGRGQDKVFSRLDNGKGKTVASLGNGKREFDNNSPEAIKMRQDMRRGNRMAR